METRKADVGHITGIVFYSLGFLGLVHSSTIPPEIILFCLSKVVLGGIIIYISEIG